MVTADPSLGAWVSKLRAALAELDAPGGGGQPPSPEASRTTGIAANIPPTTENTET
jgi:hypothetical protein